MKKLLLTLLLTLTLAMTGCANASNETNQTANNETPAENQEQQESKLSTSIKLTNQGDEVISEETVEFEEGESLMDVMDRNFDLTTGFGGDFIVGIDGLGSEEESDYYWNISVNGESLMVGASDYVLEENDEVHFDYQKVE
ncbi:MAG: DUF4430 domain-containing protein [Bacillota bacterium]|jgi:hypothetical protein|uniref:DUF4430 domain-containing protein n=1 Tax=Bacillus sp. RO2 TaxID=2723913 RepID=UPI00145F8734|nr:DUF4430 domain-containing protein [Bacillus sp. RO2]MEA3318981.1 DUF4430 domain-containing protein [Bacillota bacterium]NMH74031.1 DUF4430 domain-containing protein [Bacillus sp. RO2]